MWELEVSEITQCLKVSATNHEDLVTSETHMVEEET